MTEKEMPVELENQPEQDIIEPVEKTIHPIAEEPDVPAQEEIKKLTAELKELQDKYLRLFAEFDNFRHRTKREFAELVKTASQEVITRLLPVLDDFERAFKAGGDNWPAEAKGFELIQHKLQHELTMKGLKPMVSVGQPFDPDKHEAIAEVPAPDESKKGMVIDEVEKGYYLHEKIIRYAKVVVGK
ncbi:nucleotide exchange factor GrpE [Sphingobacteriales bacterium UPWRP_1]|nr:nucleotide exchange factor GrpE [Sphingobacteriales bacterium TSM_CSS]PSJ75581.1 nucleotide exchange factor GrpE [Sphingobacteriales bacterium UPWRP_1]